MIRWSHGPSRAEGEVGKELGKDIREPPSSLEKGCAASAVPVMHWGAVGKGWGSL